MKKMLVTGASRGIGKACVNYFKNTYDIISTARTGDVTIKGDLTNLDFRNELLSLDIDILINNAGIISNDFLETYNLNVIAAGHLMVGFYNKMNNGSIINMSSCSEDSKSWKNIEDRRLFYMTSKHCLSHLGLTLQESNKKNVKITNLEPDWTNTTFNNNSIYMINEKEYTNQQLPKIPFNTDQITRTIEWILNQQSNIVITTLEMKNFQINKSNV